MLPTTDDRRMLAAEWTGPLAERLTELAAAGDDAAFDDALLAYLRERTSPRFFFDHRAAADLGAQIAKERPEQAREVIEHADAILAHRLPAGDDNCCPYDVDAGPTIEWHVRKSPEPHYLFTINRHRFWQELAMAHWMTGDDRYLTELAAQIDSWCEQSPPLNDPHDYRLFPQSWWLLDAAVRADTWPWTLFLALSSRAWPARTTTLMVHRLLVHARHLRALTPRVGTWTMTGPNWLIMQAQGIANIALLFPELRESVELREYALDVLRLCFEAQYFPDGGHFEQSPSYSEFCLRWFAEPLHLARLNGCAGIEAVWERLRKASECIYQLTNPDGSLPALSDTDRLSGAIITQMGLFFDEPRWMRFREPSARDCWFFGSVPKTPAVTETRPPAAAYPTSGYYILRSGDDPRAIQAVFDCGPKGGGHGHSDLLSIDITGFGRPLVADPGRLVYDNSPERLWLLSTPAHNTISIDGVSHADPDVIDPPPFTVSNEQSGSNTVITARHEAYAHLAGRPIVTRTLTFDHAGLFLFLDEAEASEPHAYTVSFVLPGTAYERMDDHTICSLVGDGDILIAVRPVPGQEIAFTESFWSPNYGEKGPAMRLTITQRGESARIVSAVACIARGASVTAAAADLARRPEFR